MVLIRALLGLVHVLMTSGIFWFISRHRTSETIDIAICSNPNLKCMAISSSLCVCTSVCVCVGVFCGSTQQSISITLPVTRNLKELMMRTDLWLLPMDEFKTSLSSFLDFTQGFYFTLLFHLLSYLWYLSFLLRQRFSNWIFQIWYHNSCKTKFDNSSECQINWKQSQ